MTIEAVNKPFIYRSHLLSGYSSFVGGLFRKDGLDVSTKIQLLILLNKSVIKGAQVTTLSVNAVQIQSQYFFLSPCIIKTMHAKCVLLSKQLDFAIHWYPKYTHILNYLINEQRGGPGDNGNAVWSCVHIWQYHKFCTWILLFYVVLSHQS